MNKRPSSGPRLLVTDRNACVLLERTRVHVDGDRVVYHSADPSMIRRFNLPHCNVALILLGQGTSITQEAMHKLSEEGVLVAFTGSGGTPIMMGTLISYKATEHFRRMLRVYESEQGSLAAAKEIMRLRTVRMAKSCETNQNSVKALIMSACSGFFENIEKAMSHPQLMASEAMFAKMIYAAHCSAEGIIDFKRAPGTDTDDGRAGVMNRMIDHGNYLAYGIAGAAVWALGIPVHMSVMHGRTRPGGLVFDLADVWKDSVIIPAAAKHSKKADEKAVRQEVIRVIDDDDLLALSINAMNKVIEAGESVIGPLPKDSRYT